MFSSTFFTDISEQKHVLFIKWPCRVFPIKKKQMTNYPKILLSSPISCYIKSYYLERDGSTRMYCIYHIC